MQVAGQHCGSLLSQMATGARVRNAYPTCPPHGDSLSKERLIPDGPFPSHAGRGKAQAVEDGDASD